MSQSHGPQIVTDGLVFCVDAASKRSYSGGSEWADLVGSNDGTLTNGPTFDSDGAGCISFDGANDYVNLNSETAHVQHSTFGNFTGADTNAYSVSLWMRSTQIDGVGIFNCPTIVGRNNGDIYANLTLYDGYVYFAHYDSAWLGNIKSTTLVSDGVWHHVVYVNKTDETGDLYIDGVKEISNESSSLSNATRYFKINNIGLGYSSKYYNGDIALVQIYDKSLNKNEVLQNYNSAKGRFV